MAVDKLRLTPRKKCNCCSFPCQVLVISLDNSLIFGHCKQPCGVHRPPSFSRHIAKVHVDFSSRGFCLFHSTRATLMLVRFFVIFRLDYCMSLLADCIIQEAFINIFITLLAYYINTPPFFFPLQTRTSASYKFSPAPCVHCLLQLKFISTNTLGDAITRNM